MGFKSQNKQSNNTTYSNNTSFKIGGLIFESVDDYLIFKNLEKNINLTVDLVNNGLININDIYKNINPINVKEDYPEASEELEVLFEKVIELLCYEGTIYDNDCKVARCFLRKINIIRYDDSDDYI